MPEVRDAIVRQLESVDVRPFTIERVYRRRERKSRNRRLSAFVLVAAIFVVAVISGFRLMASADRTQPAVHTSPSPAPVVRAGRVPQTDYLLDLNTGTTTPLPESIVRKPRLSGSYAASPDGSMIAFQRADGGQIFVANVDGSHVRQVTHEPMPSQDPAWAPDGSMIAYDSYVVGGVENIFVVDLASGRTTQLTHDTERSSTHPGAAYPHFTPDGSSVLYTADEGSFFGAYAVPVTGGKSVLLLGGGHGQFEDWGGASQGFSPDGSALAVGCCGSGIWVGDADGTNMREVASDLGSYLAEPRWSPDGTRIAYWNYNTKQVFVVDLATGMPSFVARGTSPVWLNDHTLIIDARKWKG